MSGERYPESNNTTGKRAAFMIIFILVVVVALSWPAVIALEKAMEGGPGEGLVTYNASRYFFRFDYPKDWITEREQNGFLLDKDSGLVVELIPATRQEAAAEGGDDIITRYEGIQLSFYYGVPSEFYPGNVTADRVLTYYKDKLRAGMADGVYNVDFLSFVDEVNVENENTELISVDFTAYCDGKKINGTMYCAKRNKCVYAITVIHDSYAEYNTFREEIDNILKSFRLTVLSD